MKYLQHKMVRRGLWVVGAAGAACLVVWLILLMFSGAGTWAVVAGALVAAPLNISKISQTTRQAAPAAPTTHNPRRTILCCKYFIRPPLTVARSASGHCCCQTRFQRITIYCRTLSISQRRLFDR